MHSRILILLLSAQPLLAALLEAIPFFPFSQDIVVNGARAVVQLLAGTDSTTVEKVSSDIPQFLVSLLAAKNESCRFVLLQGLALVVDEKLTLNILAVDYLLEYLDSLLTTHLGSSSSSLICSHRAATGALPSRLNHDSFLLNVGREGEASTAVSAQYARLFSLCRSPLVEVPPGNQGSPPMGRGLCNSSVGVPQHDHCSAAPLSGPLVSACVCALHVLGVCASGHRKAEQYFLAVVCLWAWKRHSDVVVGSLRLLEAFAKRAKNELVFQRERHKCGTVGSGGGENRRRTLPIDKDMMPQAELNWIPQDSLEVQFILAAAAAYTDDRRVQAAAWSALAAVCEIGGNRHKAIGQEEWQRVKQCVCRFPDSATVAIAYCRVLGVLNQLYGDEPLPTTTSITPIVTISDFQLIPALVDNHRENLQLLDAAIQAIISAKAGVHTLNSNVSRKTQNR
eukprot:GHVT01067562.1.p1 GENE.GHVT01067562.1~~GHVT01067562.1.p1  ORF type:complete len:452 (-),score=56.74 GHVT01067562.1:23-1378(-)